MRSFLISSAGVLSVSALALVTAAAGATAQAPQKLKVFISVDMEGVARVIHWDDVSRDGQDYGLFHRLMTLEMNAAIAGHFGVPVVLVAGVGAICRQAREGLGEVETAAVKGREKFKPYRPKALTPWRSSSPMRTWPPRPPGSPARGGRRRGRSRSPRAISWRSSSSSGWPAFELCLGCWILLPHFHPRKARIIRLALLGDFPNCFIIYL